MTYVTGGNVQASDFDAFANSMNGVYADLFPGATTLAGNADYGYGQTGLVGVSIGGNIAASDWNSLFNTMRASGNHQGTTVIPPVPVTGPVTGNNIVAINTPTAMTAAVALLNTNRHNLAAGQSTLTVGPSFVQTGATSPWVNTLTFNYQVDFGTWNNARYFFNAGGSLNLNGSYTPSVTLDDAMWISMLGNMSPLIFNWNSTAPFNSGGGTGIGFYGLTTSYQTIYNHVHGGGGYYSAAYIQVQAKYAATAGTSGIVDFSISLNDIESHAVPIKNGLTTFRIDNVRATGSVTYPGTVTVSAVGANNGFINT